MGVHPIINSVSISPPFFLPFPTRFFLPFSSTRSRTTNSSLLDDFWKMKVNNLDPIYPRAGTECNKILETPFLSLSLELSSRGERGGRMCVFPNMFIPSRVSPSVYLLHLPRPLACNVRIYIYTQMANYYFPKDRSHFVCYKIGNIEVALKGTRYSRTRLLIGRISSPRTIGTLVSTSPFRV